MPKLPVISGREARVVFERTGWHFSRQRGSHMILVKVRDAGMTPEEFSRHVQG